jgi:predicted enzyme related to lactoylglutathione lyase
LALATASSGCSKSSAAAGGDSHKDKPQAAADGVTPARVIAGPMDTPVGRVAAVADPQGAAFALWEGAVDP